MSRDLITVFLYELRRNARRRGYLFASFGIPILLIIGMNLYIALAVNSATPTDAEAPAIVNEIDDDIGGEVGAAGLVDLAGLDLIIPDAYADLLRPYPSVAEAEAAMTDGAIASFYVVGADYLETGAVQLVLPGVSLSQISQSPINAVLRTTLARDLPDGARARIPDPADFRITNVQLTSVGAGDEDTVVGGATLLVYVFAIALTLSLFVTNGYLMQTVIEEKETRLVEILVASIRPGDLLGGKILALGLLGLAQVVAWVAMVFAAVAIAGGAQASQTLGVLAAIANIQLDPALIPLLIVYFLLAYLQFAGLYAIVSALSNSMREGPQYAVFFTIPAIFPLYFIMTFVADPNATLPVVLSIIPITAPIAMVTRLTLTAVPLGELALSIGLLVVSVVGVMWLAGRIFRVGLLLAGKVPKLSEIPRLLRN